MQPITDLGSGLNYRKAGAYTSKTRPASSLTNADVGFTLTSV